MIKPTTGSTTSPPDCPTERKMLAMEIASLRSDGFGVQHAPKQLAGLSTAQLTAVYS